MRERAISLLFMQDNAPAHKSKETIEEFMARNIIPIIWPVYSPDLNPIETIWNEMKDWLARNYPGEREVPYETLRQRIIEAWHAIDGSNLFQSAVDSNTPP